MYTNLHKPTYLVNTLHVSYIPRTLELQVSRQSFVPKTKFNIVKRAFSVAAPTTGNQVLLTTTLNRLTL